MNGERYLPNMSRLVQRLKSTTTMRPKTAAYGWGDNSCKQYKNNLRHMEAYPLLLTDELGLHHVSAGHYHSVANNNTEVYEWGNANFQDEVAATDGEHVISVSDVMCSAGGRNHSMVVTYGGSVYSWGKGNQYQLGHGGVSSLEVPQVIERLSNVNIEAIDCGWGHSIALADTGELYVWGWGKDGQLGLGNDDTVTVPTVLDNIECKVKGAVAGNDTTFIIDENDNAYSFGDGSQGVLGLRANESSYRPTLIPYFQENNIKIAAITAGYGHAMALSGINSRYMEVIKYRYWMHI
eukprot:TRINITY_DN204_c0_g1_i3.p1 TRINITY_DN204_c0_g1~~TRINITY_DN204_c0_g1_i3.p1  ORF type:complete len:294 (-),score=48.71 TRINITY_DN204_c0_g1_i3:374-1255(-)